MESSFIPKKIIVFEGFHYSDSINFHTYDTLIDFLKKEGYDHYQDIGRSEFYRHPNYPIMHNEPKKTEVLFNDDGKIIKVLHS
jgi:hypothetical protein